MNGSVSLISFSVHLLMVYRKDVELCPLTVYLDTLLRVFISSGSFPVEFLGLIMYCIRPSANRDSVTNFFCNPLICFSCHIAPASASSTILRSGDNEHPYFFLGLSGIGLRLFPFMIMLKVDSSYIAFIMCRWVPSSPLGPLS